MNAFEQFLSLGPDAKVLDAIKALKESNASVIKIISKNKDNQPLAAAIFVHGKTETAEIISAIQAIEDAWYPDEEETS